MAKRYSLSAVVLAALLAGGVALAGQQPNRVPAEGGDIVITPILHASVQVEHAGTVVHVDPWSVGDLSQAKPADLILVTDDPSHHLDPEAIERLRKPGAPVVVTATAHENFPDGTVLANGQRGTFGGRARRSGGGARHDAGAAVAPAGRGERLRRHAGRTARSSFQAWGSASPRSRRCGTSTWRSCR